ncbi:ribosomal protein L7/L12 C-terminal domain-domain-containing protein [Kockovaella imperatae]|uniref:Ribosomal protein L7/L12 C-terminal domain-domain-containing protein n=1 Tax=Kockovaella imperatae TaxID=4999 RepID=A0A1Y1UMA2_9TREE|nr:ribosomal protein L7/L12 C-terminal domain-domain-containing protein [Kockovaella imperatae]ORX39181.1 ribosomal protein L7/L12 C-terminal domain-domain-containing protein [Kockovaella imperatae]
MPKYFSSSSTLLDTPPPAAQPGPSSASPKIAQIVDTISQLTLLEVSELVTELKTRLNITEIAMPAASAAPAAAPAAAAAEAPAEEKPKEKTMFTVKLEAIDAAQKAKIIREVKAMMPNMNLVEAKKFVESTPQTLKENMPKEEAEKLQKTLQAIGATVTLS